MITFADKAKTIKNKYYKTRNPGEDKMTDDAFNREMQDLVNAQEAVKAEMHDDNQNSFAYGGGLSYPMTNNNPFGFEMNPITSNNVGRGLSGLQNPTSLTLNPTDKLPITDSGSGANAFSPVTSVIGPAISISSTLLANHIRKKGLEEQRERLQGLAGGINLGRVDAVQVDLGKARADVRGQQGLTEATGRYNSRNIRSAAERANLRNQSRISAQRIAGSQLSKLHQSEETQNAQLRNQAQNTNRQLAAQEARIKQQQLMNIERQFGGSRAAINASTASSIGQSVNNYLSENQRMKRDQQYLNMLNPNFAMDYQSGYNELSPFNQRLARLGMRQVNPQIKVR